jgi:fatty acid desaturase
MFVTDRENGPLMLPERALRTTTSSKIANADVKAAASRMPADAAVRRALRERLPSDFGQRQPLRLGWLVLALVTVAVHLALTQAILVGAASGWWMLLSLPIAAFSFPFIFFALHELCHGAILAPGPMRRIASAVAAFPILLQPTFWTAVHNHHHRFTNHEQDFDRRRVVGDTEVTGMFHEFNSPLVVFTLICSVQLVYYCQLAHFLAGRFSLPVQRRQVLIELAVGAVCTVAVSWLMGWKLLLCGWLPCAAAGFFLHSLYLISNHLTRPMATEADSLGTGVSVRLFRDWSHMDFGRHVEHHLFPHVPANRLAPVTAGLREHYPTRFQEGTLLATTRRLFQLPGYYLTSHELTDRSGSWRVTID